MNYKQFDSVIQELNKGYQIKKRDNGEDYYIYEGKHDEIEKQTRFNTDSTLNGIEFTAHVAYEAINFLANLADLDYYNEDTALETMTDRDFDDIVNSGFLTEYIDDLCIYTANNNAIIAEYGLDNAIDLYKEQGFEGNNISASSLAYVIWDSSIREYIKNLFDEIDESLSEETTVELMEATAEA